MEDITLYEDALILLKYNKLTKVYRLDDDTNGFAILWSSYETNKLLDCLKSISEHHGVPSFYSSCGRDEVYNTQMLYELFDNYFKGNWVELKRIPKIITVILKSCRFIKRGRLGRKKYIASLFNKEKYDYKCIKEKLQASEVDLLEFILHQVERKKK